MTTAPEGGWRVGRAAIEEDANAIDALVRLALASIEDETAPSPVQLWADGDAVPVAGDGSFRVGPGTEVIAVCGTARTAARGPCSIPVPPAERPDDI
ncbi:MAG: hypothetical protein WKF43_08785 [Acidimicrobiales bacterium]